MKITKNISCLFLLLIMFVIFSPQNVYADSFDSHDTYMLIPQIDEQNNKFTFNVQFDSNAFGKTLEERGNVNWSAYLNTNTNVPSSKGLDLNITLSDSQEVSASSSTSVIEGMQPETDSVQVLMFSFPAKKSEDAGLFAGKGTTAGDQQRAYEIGENLTIALNGMLKALDSLDSDTNIKNIVDLYNGVNEVRPDISSSGDFVEKEISGLGVSLHYGTKIDGIENNVPQGNVDSGELYVYITREGEELSVSSPKFTWAMLKGYLGPEGQSMKQTEGTSVVLGKTGPTYIGGLTNSKLKGGSPADDAVWISMFNLADVAMYSTYGPMPANNSFWNSLTSVRKANSSVAQTTFIEELITGIFRTVVLGLKTILGLDDIYDLVYNGGPRGANSYESGMMNNNWWSIMLKYHMIFQIIAWMSIGLAVAKLLVEINYSTINPRLRMSIMEMLQKIFVVGFLLALSIPIIKLMATLNNYIVSIFQTQAQTDTGMFDVGNTIASLFAYMSYFGILCVLNATYIIRSIMIAILAASAPLFIVSMVFSKQQGLFTSWFKEISANIFLQAIHSFSLAFLFEILDRGKFIEIMVGYFSLLPITEMFRGLIFGQSGGFASKQGNQLGSLMASTVKDGVKATANGAMGAVGNKMNLKRTQSNDGSVEGGREGGSGGGNRQPMTGGQKLMNALSDSGKAGQGSGKGGLASAMSAGMAGAGNLLSTLDSMGEMAFQSNVGNHQGATMAGKQLAQNVGNATQFMGDSGVRQAMATAYGAGGQLKGKSTFKEGKAKYLDYCQGTRASLKDDGPNQENFAFHTQANGDRTVAFNKGIVNENGMIKPQTINTWRTSGQENLEQMANAYEGKMLTKSSSGSWIANETTSMRRAQSNYNTEAYKQTNKEAGVQFADSSGSFTDNHIGSQSSLRSPRREMDQSVNNKLQEDFLKQNIKREEQSKKQ